MLKSLLKRLLLIIPIFLIVVFGVLYYYRDGVAQYGLSVLNSYLKEPLHYQEVSLTLLEDFPNASLNIQGVRLPGTDKKMLFAADHLYLRTNLWDLLSRKYRFKHLAIEHATIDIHYSKKGLPNFLVFATQAGAEESNLALLFDAIELRKVDVVFNDPINQIQFKENIIDGRLTGTIVNDRIHFDVEGALLSRYFKSGQYRFLSETPVSLDGTLRLNTSKQHYDLEGFDLTIANSACQLDGYYQSHRDHSEMNFLLRSDEAELRSLVALLPEQYKSKLDHFQSRGKIQLETTIKGTQSKSSAPAITLQARLNNGAINSELLGAPVDDVAFELVFNNGKQHHLRSSTLQISDFKGRLAGDPFDFDLKVANFEDPHIEFSGNGKFDLNNIYKLAPDLGINDAQGTVLLSDLSLNGRWRHLTELRTVDRVNVRGFLEASNVTLAFGKESLVIDSGELDMNNNTVELLPMITHFADSDFTLEGHLNNLFPAILNWNEAQGPPLLFALNLNAEQVDVKRLVGLGGETTEFKARGTSPEAQLTYTDQLKQNLRKLKGTFAAEVDAFQFGDIKGTAFSGQLVLAENSFRLRGNTQAMKGRVELDGTVHLEDRPQLTSKLTFQSIDSKTLFQQTGNLGQEIIRSEHLEGTLTALSTIDANWNADGVFLMDELSVHAAIAMIDGRLKELDLLNSLSDFIQAQRLRDVRFSDMQTFVQVRNSRLYIPYLKIHSSAGDLDVNGIHDFANRYQYNLKVYKLDELVVDRLRKREKLEHIEMGTGLGLFNLHVRVTGEGDQYDYGISRKQVKEAFAKGEGHSRQVHTHLSRYFPDVNILNKALKHGPSDDNLFNQLRAQTPPPRPAPAPETAPTQEQYDEDEDEVFLDFMVPDTN